MLPERAEGYNSSCPLCASVWDIVTRRRECARCPWPGEGADRCTYDASVFTAWSHTPSTATARPVFELMKQLAKGETAKDAEITFKVGDRVKLVDMHTPTDGVYFTGRSNPLWGSKEGNVRGTVTAVVTPRELPLSVIWENGTQNSYLPRNLAHLIAEESYIEIVSGRLYKYEDHVLLAINNTADDWSEFYTLKGRLVASGEIEEDVFDKDPGGFDVRRDKLIPTGKSLQDLYDYRAE